MSDVVVVSEAETPVETPPVVVVETAPEPDDTVALRVGELTALSEQQAARIAELEQQVAGKPDLGTVIDVASEVASEAVVEAAVVAEAVAEETSEAVAEETTEEVLDDIQQDESPAGKPWTHKSAREWFGKGK